MKLLEKIRRIIVDSDYRFIFCAEHGLFNYMSDEEYIMRMYKAQFGCIPDLLHPQTYNEKIQWLKLHDHNPLYSQMVDKIEAKKLVADTIGEQYIIPTLGIWKTFDEIDFDALPNQFVVKCSHDSGGIAICRDKRQFDIKRAKKNIIKSFSRNYYWQGREWPYKNIEPRVFVEKYMEDDSGTELKDYKFFCFNGEVKALFIASDRQNKMSETKFDFYDADFNHLPFTNGHPNADDLPIKPSCFYEMKNIAKQLSKDIPHVRVDLYEVNGKVFFGELTLYHWSGFVPFNPPEWDEIFGSWLTLPTNINT